MFTTTHATATAKPISPSVLHHAAAFGMAVVVTFGILGSIDQLAAAPSPHSVLATAASAQIGG